MKNVEKHGMAWVQGGIWQRWPGHKARPNKHIIKPIGKDKRLRTSSVQT